MKTRCSSILKPVKSKKLSPSQLKERELLGKLWHRRMAHASAPYIHKRKKVAEGVDELVCNEKLNNCEVCAVSKLTRKSFDKDRESATRVGQILHADLVGQIKPKSFHTKKEYILVVMDDYSRFLQTFVLKSKNETARMLDEAFCVIQSRYPGVGQFEKLRCDKGGEFDSGQTDEVLKKYGARKEQSETDVHEHNGSAERVIRTLEQKIRALLFESGFPAYFWEQLADTATWLYNRTPHFALDFLTPYEIFYNQPPDVSNIRVIGSKCCVYNPHVPKGRKWDARGTFQYLIGFTPTGYRTYDPKTKKSSEECIVTINEDCLYGNDFPSDKSCEQFELPIETRATSFVNERVTELDDNVKFSSSVSSVKVQDNSGVLD